MVKHILSNGSVLDDITGHVVKQEEAQLVYEIIGRINKEREVKEDGSQV